MATPTKNSAEEAESPTRCVAATERLQMVAFPATSGTSANLASKRRHLTTQQRAKNHAKVPRLSPKRVVEVGLEGLVPAVATVDGHDVLRAESAAASEGEYRRELTREREKVRETGVVLFLSKSGCSNAAQHLNSFRQEASDSARRPCDSNALLYTDSEGILLLGGS